jgi:hypothetical protein
LHLYFLRLLDWPIVGTVASGVVARMTQFRSGGCFYALGRVVDRTAMTTYARFSGDAACHFSLGRNSWWIHARAIPEERRMRCAGLSPPPVGRIARLVRYTRAQPSDRGERQGLPAACRHEAVVLGVLPLGRANHHGRSALSTATFFAAFLELGKRQRASTGGKSCVSVWALSPAAP